MALRSLGASMMHPPRRKKIRCIFSDLTVTVGYCNQMNLDRKSGGLETEEDKVWAKS